MQFMLTPAHAVSAISVSSTTVAAGETFTIDFTGTADTPRTGAGENFYSGSTELGSLGAFTSIESCTGNTAPCVEVEGYGPRVPLGDLGGGQPFSGSVTLRVDPETPAGTCGPCHRRPHRVDPRRPERGQRHLGRRLHRSPDRPGQLRLRGSPHPPPG